MATTKITDLTAYTDPVNTDVLPIVDVTSDVTKKVSIANVMKNASLGTAAAPGIAFDGDPNTGIYSPGANQVAITTDGTQRLLIDSAGAVTIAGDLTVNGTTTNINTQNLVVEDKNIVLGDVTTPTDVTADGGGITLKGTTDKTINWVDSTDAWTSSERFSYPTGSAAAPTLTFTGDTNTGIYSPGADQVAISTGGSGRLFVDSSGNVSIGATGAESLLTVRGTSARILVRDEGTPIRAQFDVDSTNSLARIGSRSNHPLVFTIQDTERMRLTSTGLGVGTSSPTTRFHVDFGDAAANSIRLVGDGATNGAALATSWFSGSSYFDVRLGGNTTSETKLRIQSDGKVGIGTSSPSFPLHVAGGRTLCQTGNEDYSLGIARSGATNAYYLGVHSSTSPNLLFSNNAGTTRMVLTDGGSLGIGTTSPGTYGQFAVRGAAATGSYGNVSGHFSDASTGSFFIGHTSNTLKLFTDTSNLTFGFTNSEAARIDSSGRLLVGTSSSSSNTRLVVQGNSASSAGTGVMHLQYGSSTTNILNNYTIADLNYGDSAGNVGAQIKAAADANWGASSFGSRLTFSTTADGASSPTERMRIRNTGQVWINQTANMSGTTDSVILQAKATGGDFVASLDNTNASGGYGLYIRYTGGAPNNTANQFLYCQDTGSVRAEIRSNGGLANYSANNANLSDINAKKDITPAAGTWDCIKEWEIVNYRYKDQPDDADLNLGVIAQQVAESCPEVITVFQEAKEATEDQPAQEERLGVKEQQMYWMAIKALQEAQVRIEALEAEVAALKAQ